MTISLLSAGKDKPNRKRQRKDAHLAAGYIKSTNLTYFLSNSTCHPKLSLYLFFRIFPPRIRHGCSSRRKEIGDVARVLSADY